MDPFIFHYYLIGVICACPARPVAPGDGTGVGPEDRTGVICGSFPHKSQYNPQDQPYGDRDEKGENQPAKDTQLPDEGVALQRPINNYLQFLHLEWLGNVIVGPFLGDSDTESAWELFANEEGSEAKEQKVGLPEEGMLEQLVGLVTGKDAQ